MARHPGASRAGRGHRHHPAGARADFIASAAAGWRVSGGGNTFLWLFGIVSLNAFISIAILFAISPIIEMAFRYTTRFRLMELMNLEQPLLQDLMVAIPGTYHTRWSSPTWWRPEPRPWARTACCARSRPSTTTSASWLSRLLHRKPVQRPQPARQAGSGHERLILLSHVKKGTELAAQHHLATKSRTSSASTTARV